MYKLQYKWVFATYLQWKVDNKYNILTDHYTNYDMSWYLQYNVQWEINNTYTVLTDQSLSFVAIHKYGELKLEHV